MERVLALNVPSYRGKVCHVIYFVGGDVMSGLASAHQVALPLSYVSQTLTVMFMAHLKQNT